MNTQPIYIYHGRNHLRKFEDARRGQHFPQTLSKLWSGLLSIMYCGKYRDDMGSVVRAYARG